MSEDLLKQIDDLKLENEQLRAGFTDLSTKVAELSAKNSNASPAKSEQPKIPTDPISVKVGKKEVKIKFLVPKFRLTDGVEVTALEASTDDTIMQELIDCGSGVIQIIE